MRKGVLCFLKQNKNILLFQTAFDEGLFWNGISGVIEKDEEPT